MDTLFREFPLLKKLDWLETLTKELKGAPISNLHKTNPIEEIAFPSYFHKEDAIPSFSEPGELPYTRGSQAKNNDWNIATPFKIAEEKTTNNEILLALMSGTTSLILHATDENTIDFSILLNEVGMEYISCYFYPKTEQQTTDFLNRYSDFSVAVISEEMNHSMELAKEMSVKKVRPFGINAAQIQQAGGTTWQEIAFALSEGHEVIVQQLEKGLTIDEAASNVHFVFGIGNKYFFEVAKLRAFRTLWTQIIAKYSPVHTCSCAANLLSVTGFLHISLKDPYTNLLRQTTEGMSAIMGGCSALGVYPFDWYAEQQEILFSRRMATNISLILKEESYLDKVIDPAGGSYAIDNLTETISERAWSEFISLENTGGIRTEESKTQFSQQIIERADLRVSRIRSKEDKIIGINLFENPEKKEGNWSTLPTLWNNLESLVLEKSIAE